MKFSIITVCKNSSDTIENTILSVLNQAFKGFEHIIIDGVSTDGTLDVVNKYRDKIAVVISEPDNGLYDAMNKGIRYSSGDYIFFLNSDDMFLDGSVLQKAANSVENNKKELLYGDQAFVNNGLRKHNKLNKIYLMKNTPCQPATFYRRDVFDKYGDFDTNFKIVSDQEWFLRAFLHHNVSRYYLGFAVTIFNSGGISTSLKREEELNRERDEMFRRYFSESERKKLEFLSKYLRCFTTFPVIRQVLNMFFKFEL